MEAIRLRRKGMPALLLALALSVSIAPITGSTDAARAIVDPALHAARGVVSIIVQALPGGTGDAARVIERTGGAVERELGIINGFSARVPASSIERIARDPSVRVISLDRKMYPQNTGGGAALKSVYTKAVKASNAWSAGLTGTGVTVALVDTGVANVADLAGRVLQVEGNPGTLPGTLSPCIDLSGEGNCNDSYGHGTFIAGIIAGNGAASDGAWKGVAPNANLVSVKIAGRDGAADVSGVLAAIQWVVSFKDRYNIRVLNLSLGTDSTQSYRVDPLNYAVERAWDSGVAVVVSASNRGPDAGTISKPGDDPLVITVGAVDDRATSGVGDDALPLFSSRGPTAADGIAKPDVVAPGAHMTSLRATGSEIDARFPNYIDGAYRKGSGTSMSAGVVSGAAALYFQANPTATPDRLKFALTSTARSVASTDRMAVGSGEIDVQGALAAPAGVANQGVERSSGLGSLDASRGTVRLAAEDPQSTLIGGTLTAQMLVYDPVAFTTTSWDGMSWYGMSWYGMSWYGMSWYGMSWYGMSWYGMSWYGEMDGMSWYGMSWYGGAWYGAWE